MCENLPILTEYKYNKVIEELQLFYNDKKYRKKLNEKIMKKHGYKYEDGFYTQINMCDEGVYRTNMYSNIVIYDSFLMKYKECDIVKCGIEVLCLTDDKRMKGNRITLKELKNILKDNKVKGYSKLKKKEIIKKLIKL